MEEPAEAGSQMPVAVVVGNRMRVAAAVAGSPTRVATAVADRRMRVTPAAAVADSRMRVTPAVADSRTQVAAAVSRRTNAPGSARTRWPSRRPRLRCPPAVTTVAAWVPRTGLALWL